jgi:hypothetical protein
MKKLILIICLCFLSLGAFSQKKNAWSLETGASTYAYIFPSEDYISSNTGFYQRGDNNFNYSAFILLSKYYYPLRISTGIIYFTKNITLNTSDKIIYQIDYNVDYLRLPILLSYEYLLGKHNFYLRAGITLDKIMNFNVDILYGEKGSFRFNSFALSALFGIGYKVRLSNVFNLSINPYIESKIVKERLNSIDNSANYPRRLCNEIPNDIKAGGLLSYGLSIGFEYVF